MLLKNRHPRLTTRPYSSSQPPFVRMHGMFVHLASWIFCFSFVWDICFNLIFKVSAKISQYPLLLKANNNENYFVDNTKLREALLFAAAALLIQDVSRRRYITRPRQEFNKPWRSKRQLSSSGRGVHHVNQPAIDSPIISNVINKYFLGYPFFIRSSPPVRVMKTDSLTPRWKEKKNKSVHVSWSRLKTTAMPPPFRLFKSYSF